MKAGYLLALILISAVLVAGCVQQPTGGTGNLLVGIKDKQIRGENVTAITLTVKSVQVHYSGPITGNELRTGERKETELNATEDNDTDVVKAGWITVFEGSKTFNLLDYVGNVTGILGEVELQPGEYEQIRLYIDSATITVNGQTQNLTVPSKVLKFVEGFQVEANKTLFLTLDFDSEKSIVKDARGYKLKPVIKLKEIEVEGKVQSGELENETNENLEDIEE